MCVAIPISSVKSHWLLEHLVGSLLAAFFIFERWDCPISHNIRSFPSSSASHMLGTPNDFPTHLCPVY